MADRIASVLGATCLSNRSVASSACLEAAVLVTLAIAAHPRSHLSTSLITFWLQNFPAELPLHILAAHAYRTLARVIRVIRDAAEPDFLAGDARDWACRNLADTLALLSYLPLLVLVWRQYTARSEYVTALRKAGVETVHSAPKHAGILHTLAAGATSLAGPVWTSMVLGRGLQIKRSIKYSTALSREAPPSLPSSAFSPASWSALVNSAVPIVIMDRLVELGLALNARGTSSSSSSSSGSGGGKDAGAGITFGGGLELLGGVANAPVRTRGLYLDLYWHPGSQLATPTPSASAGGAGAGGSKGVSAERHLRSSLRPVFMYIHGGGWVVGDRTMASRPLILGMARKGYLVAAVGYRLAPRVAYPGQLHDAKRALLWLKEHVSEYGGDPSCILVAGESAGGHLALMTGLTANVPQLHPPPSPEEGEGEGEAQAETGGGAAGGNGGRQSDRPDATSLASPRQPPASTTSSRGSRAAASTGGATASGSMPSTPALPDTSVQGIVDLYGVTDWTDSAGQWSGRVLDVGAWRVLIERFVAQASPMTNRWAYVEGSPLWWMHGAGVAGALASAGLDLPGLDKALQSGSRTAPAHAPAPSPLFPAMSTDRALPPLMVVHGSGDTLVPVTESRMLVQALKERRKREAAGSCGDSGSSGSADGVPCLDTYVELTGAHHAYNYVPSPRTAALTDAVVDWCTAVVHATRTRAGK